MGDCGDELGVLGAEFCESGYSLFVFECVANGFGEQCAFRSEEGLVRVTAQEAIQVFDELWVSPPTLVRSRAVFPVATGCVSVL